MKSGTHRAIVVDRTSTVDMITAATLTGEVGHRAEVGMGGYHEVCMRRAECQSINRTIHVKNPGYGENSSDDDDIYQFVHMCD